MDITTQKFNRSTSPDIIITIIIKTIAIIIIKKGLGRSLIQLKLSYKTLTIGLFKLEFIKPVDTTTSFKV